MVMVHVPQIGLAAMTTSRRLQWTMWRMRLLTALARTACSTLRATWRHSAHSPLYLINPRIAAARIQRQLSLQLPVQIHAVVHVLLRMQITRRHARRGASPAGPGRPHRALLLLLLLLGERRRCAAHLLLARRGRNREGERILARQVLHAVRLREALQRITARRPGRQAIAHARRGGWLQLLLLLRSAMQIRGRVLLLIVAARVGGHHVRAGAAERLPQRLPAARRHSHALIAGRRIQRHTQRLALQRRSRLLQVPLGVLRQAFADRLVRPRSALRMIELALGPVRALLPVRTERRQVAALRLNPQKVVQSGSRSAQRIVGRHKAIADERVHQDAILDHLLKLTILLRQISVVVVGHDNSVVAGGQLKRNNASNNFHRNALCMSSHRAKSIHLHHASYWHSKKLTFRIYRSS